MRAFFVLLAAEAIETPLLCLLVAFGWPGRFRFEGPVHALVCPVLLGSARRHALMADAELDPPHGERAQAAEGGGGERRPVVGANGLRQAILLVEALEDRACLHL